MGVGGGRQRVTASAHFAFATPSAPPQSSEIALPGARVYYRGGKRGGVRLALALHLLPSGPNDPAPAPPSRRKLNGNLQPLPLTGSVPSEIGLLTALKGL